MTPQVAATTFAVILAFMLLFPFVNLSFEGAEQSTLLIFLLKTDFGLNIFALILLLSPIVGLFAAMTMRKSWAIITTVTAGIGAIMVPLAVLMLRHETNEAPNVMPHVAPTVGTIVFALGLGILAITAGIAAFRERRSDGE
jgi:hypothetical protein